MRNARLGPKLVARIMIDMAGALGFILFIGVCLAPLLILP